VTGRFRRLYGASPAHLVAVGACFGVAAYALARALELTANPDRILLWLGGSIVAHDLVLFPFYAVLGIAAAALVAPPASRNRLRIAALNHLRAPVLASGLLLLVWFPLVGGRAERTFMRSTGLGNEVYLGRWLVLSAVLFAVSALVFCLRMLTGSLRS
jgi:hypothetical protein